MSHFFENGSSAFLFDYLSLGFYYCNLTWENSEFELASTITLILQANRLTKCVSRYEFRVFPSKQILTQSQQ